MKRGRILLAVFLVTVFPFSSSAQEPEEFERLGQCSMTFLEIDIGARAVGMGGAYTCMDNDINSIFWNPAGIAKIDGAALSLSNCQWIADINQYAFTAAYGTGAVGTFGVSFVYYDNGELERTIPTLDIENNPEGYYIGEPFRVQQWAAGIAYARQITDKFAVGGQLKYCYEDFGEMDIIVPVINDSTGYQEGWDKEAGSENREGVFALDFGTIYYFGFKDLRLGMSLRNFAQGVTYAFETFSLPLTYKVAIAMNVLSLIPQMDHHSLQVSFATVSPYDGGERIHLGCEYLFRNILALRGGYKTNTDTGALAAGFGLTPRAFGTLNLQFDYAYSEADKAFGAIHRFSVGFGF
ncbi:MAG: PorV/PorQ family protein [Candidatus Neomarinimicrobiota bacterium]